jgi:biopolymer transport protein ExbD
MSAQSLEGAEPNLTPMLDMVFQLVTFFMLVINFKGASLDQSLKLPVLGSARPLDWEAGKEPVTLNVDTEGLIRVYGKTETVEKYMEGEVRTMKALMAASGQAVEGKIDRPVILRADKDVQFQKLNHVIKVCQDLGFHNFQLSAMTRAEGK